MKLLSDYLEAQWKVEKDEGMTDVEDFHNLLQIHIFLYCLNFCFCCVLFLWLKIKQGKLSIMRVFCNE